MRTCYQCGSRKNLSSIGQGEYICKTCKENKRKLIFKGL